MEVFEMHTIPLIDSFQFKINCNRYYYRERSGFSVISEFKLNELFTSV